MIRQFSRYIFVGIVNTLWSYAVIFGLMYGLRWSPEASNVAGYAVGLVTSYGLHRVFTFESRNRKAPEFVRFIVIFAIAFCANFLVLTLMVRVLDADAGISQVIAGVVYVLSSYAMSRGYVFNRRAAGSRPR
jgi:putative flippase GtrA